MTKTEMHYLRCTNINCEVFACVARRDYEQKIANLEFELNKKQIDIDALLPTTTEINTWTKKFYIKYGDFPEQIATWMFIRDHIYKKLGITK